MGEAAAVEPAGSAVVAQAEAVAIDNVAVAGTGKSRPNGPPSLWRSIPWWVIVTGLIVLAVLIWKIGLFVRLQKGAANTQTGMGIQPASDEPDTTRLQLAAQEPGARPRSGIGDAVELPDLGQLPDGCDAFIMLQGMIDPDTPVSGYCAVRQNQFDIVIGRGDADIRIEHPAISRRHARLLLEDDSMTLSDLGSSNGTYIGAVPCLAGDIMYVQSSDQVFLGGVGFYIRIISKESELQ